jgi:hypothetical protein
LTLLWNCKTCRIVGVPCYDEGDNSAADERKIPNRFYARERHASILFDNHSALKGEVDTEKQVGGEN